jgi:hypothetical protein
MNNLSVGRSVDDSDAASRPGVPVHVSLFFRRREWRTDVVWKLEGRAWRSVPRELEGKYQDHP